MDKKAEDLIQRQAELFGRISRTVDNLKKLGQANMTEGAVRSRVLNLDQHWFKVEEAHDTLRSAYSDVLRDHEYMKADFIGTIEEKYLQTKGILLDILATFDRKNPSTSVSAEPAEVKQCKSSLPRIQLPVFSGRYEDWPSFRDLFESIVGREEGLSNVERLHYLKVSLNGEAHSIVKNLPTTEQNYTRAWKLLVDHYENKRLLVRSVLNGFTALKPSRSESLVDLKRVYQCVMSTVGSMESIERPIISGEDLFVFLISELFDPRTRREWEDSLGETLNPPTFQEVKTFLERQIHTLEALKPASEANRLRVSETRKSQARTHHVQKKETEKCILCKGAHFVMRCEEYQGRSPAERRAVIESNQRCVNCLGRHIVNKCPSTKVCSACSEQHHTSLHNAFQPIKPVESTSTTHVARKFASGRTSVLLATARVCVEDRTGRLHEVRALVDQGSETSIISEKLAQLLRLPRSSANIAIFGVGGRQTGVAKGMVSLSIVSKNERRLHVTAIILPRLTAYQGELNSSITDWLHLQGLTLADPAFAARDTIDVLLGADVYASIVRKGLRRGGPHDPVAQDTIFGWIVSGCTSASAAAVHLTTHQCIVGEPLNALVRRFWEQEELPPAPAPLTESEQRCEEHFRQTHARDSSGRYVVRLPVIPDMPDLSATRRAAMRVMESQEARFLRKPAFAELYKDFMKIYEISNYMSLAEAPASCVKPRVCYLPHHGVIRESSTTTKLRVVFNGSANTPTGDALNKSLLTGPNLLAPLADLLLRWRQHRYVISADIEKMYRQIDVHPDDRDLQRIVWRADASAPLQEYQLNTVTYGTACAPFLAIRTLRQLADDEKIRFPLGSTVLIRDSYVDDIITGADTVQEASKIQGELIELCKAGGFPLRKWSSNSNDLLTAVPEIDRLQHNPLSWDTEPHSMLGLQWSPLSDCFSYVVNPVPEGQVTKRTVLSTTARLFDPLGWLAPVVVRAKILVQSAWLLGLDWDAPMQETEASVWITFCKELPLLSRIRVQRWLQIDCRGGLMELHGFADASERAYAAAVYLRTVKPDGQASVTLVMAKSKVAPVKQISLPRLELCAAVLLARLVRHVQTILQLSSVEEHLWTDSKVTLAWIQGHPCKWKTYVANRVADIQRVAPAAHWHHLPGVHNPADCASRGISPSDLANHPLWWHGPEWLIQSTASWPDATEVPRDDNPPEQRRVQVYKTQVAPEEPEFLTRFSSLSRLLRVTAWCLRWTRKSEDSTALAKGSAEAQSLTAAELTRAEQTWIRAVQATKFKAELSAIQKGHSLAKGSPLTHLTPFIDAVGILRVSGRLKHSLLSFDEKHPVILPSSSMLTTLVIESCHKRTLHGGVQQTLGLTRQRFWILQGRRAVKHAIHRCTCCVRWRAAPAQQIMGNLPSSRVRPARPFQFTGVDYAGPFMLRTAPGRGHKAYKGFVVVFICLSSRAVHLDLVSSYSAEAFLAAFRRFTARRGLCSELYSDCGTTFTGADAELRRMFAATSREAGLIAQVLAEDRVQWKFNPPAAPHFGGIWEAAVKSTKHHLRRVIGDVTLTFEEMSTLLASIEACLNSRPLQALTDDPEDTAALTPGHFLVGSALNSLPEPSLLDTPASRLSRWQHLQQMRDHFWARWSQEYLQSLLPRSKWRTVHDQVAVGRLCLILQENTPPSKWPLARVVQTYPGSDGRVRVVRVKTSTTELDRPIAKIVVLPVSTGSDDSESNQEPRS